MNEIKSSAWFFFLREVGIAGLQVCFVFSEKGIIKSE